MKKVLPAEWHPQRFIQLTWPHEQTDWNYMLDEVNACYVEIAKTIASYQDLLIVCKDEYAVRKLLQGIDIQGVHFVELASNDTWARDHGGITVLEDDKPVIYDFAFNAWGKKFAYDLDNQLTQKLYELGALGDDVGYRNCLDFVLEGGSIESDGQGTLLTTSQCLLADNRNDLNQNEIEEKLKDYFSLKRVLWLHHGYLQGDDTDSHIDTLARFCDENTIAYVRCEDENDEHYEELKKMEEELQAFRTQDGKPYVLIPLPMADAVYFDGERLPATYANFLIMNEVVLVPTYASEKDKKAIYLLSQAFPKKEIIGIDCSALIKQHGSLHCITMEFVKL